MSDSSGAPAGGGHARGIRFAPRPIVGAVPLVRCVLAAALLSLAGCGSNGPAGPAPSPQPTPHAQVYSVTSVTDGDTLRIAPSLDGSSALRMLNIDSPEIAQAPWGDAARGTLQQAAPAGTAITIETDRTRLDAFDRVLGHAITREGVNLNAEQLRRGQAVLYVIWPNISRLDEYRAAQIEAQSAGRGIWDPAAPLRELPFEYRLRIDRDAPFRPVGDYSTRRFVEPPDYARVHVNNRVFFNNTADAGAAGYAACPRDSAGAYDPSCFGSAR
ncbi:MAG: thermonuclease family protein [Vicinamibacterales bacterium]